MVKRFAPNDILFGKLRPYLAKVTYATRPGVCVGEFLVLRARSAEILPRYMEQLLRSKRFIGLVNSSTAGAKMPRADWTFIGNVRLSIPPIPEQNEILACIDRASKPLVDAMRRANDEITLIREYRARLISDVVTGQIDVRNWTPDPGDTLAEDDPMALAEISESDANEEEVEPD